MPTPTHPTWRKSTHSGPDNGSCLEVADDSPASTLLRDSKAPNGPTLAFPAADWSSFVTALKRGTLTR
ncbi:MULTISPECIES: DUF397 domain-containing protein [unclassified Streptomyces]|uniref:DUF397 domain-containing protein n=1 Tax=unclassified Streptomyces TaxID=2593676 RepID=UPI000CD5AED9|nr:MULTISPECIES: DUF397 domain-containing protein [unclassified Streptomyces]